MWISLGAPTCDEYGNCRGIGGKTNCGVLSYSYVDGNQADYVVAVTDSFLHLFIYRRAKRLIRIPSYRRSYALPS